MSVHEGSESACNQRTTREMTMKDSFLTTADAAKHELFYFILKDKCINKIEDSVHLTRSGYGKKLKLRIYRQTEYEEERNRTTQTSKRLHFF